MFGLSCAIAQHLHDSTGSEFHSRSSGMDHWLSLELSKIAHIVGQY